MYNRAIVADEESTPRVRIVESDVDLYYHMAFELYRALVAKPGAQLVCIVPVGPVFYLRRFAWLVRTMPVDCSGLHLFFMDEYLGADGRLIAADDPLSFRGFVRRELVEPPAGQAGFRAAQVYFPDPDDTAEYDRRIDELGGADICLAGVGINGHLAFNEPPSVEDPTWKERGTRVVDLSRETRTINSNTALGGAFEKIPTRAVTIGMRQILAGRRLRVFLNRPWQRAVVRKMLYGPVGSAFPASYTQRHPDAVVTLTEEVAVSPSFGLR